MVADGFEQVELTVPREAPGQGRLQRRDRITQRRVHDAGAINHGKGEAFSVDVPIAKASPIPAPRSFLPGGVHNPDALRQDEKVLDFIRHFFAAGKAGGGDLSRTLDPD